MASANWVRNDDAGGSASAVGSGSSKKRKRNRPAVSCTSCKQRWVCRTDFVFFSFVPFICFAEHHDFTACSRGRCCPIVIAPC